MENLLPPEVRVCSDCQQPFRFGVSRFGCVFTCVCPRKCVDVAKVVSKYIQWLDMGYNWLSYVPVITSESHRGTASFRFIAVELNAVDDVFQCSFINFSSEEKNGTVAMLPFSFQSYVQSGCVPLGLGSVLLNELESVRSSSSFLFFVCPPSAELLSRYSERVLPPVSTTTVNLSSVLPSALSKHLRHHQLQAIEKVLQIGARALIADEMGVGKTLEGLGVVAAIHGYPLLLVVPSALKVMWAEEIEKFLIEHVPVDEIHIIKGANDALPHDRCPKVVITSFHMVAALYENISRVQWKCVLCDEAHFLHTNVKNTDALYTSAVCSLAKEALHCIFLTGTPATASPFDMFNILDAISPGFFGHSRWDFALRYCRIHLHPHVKVMECHRPVELSSLLRQRFMVRRTKGEILDLPQKYRTVLRVSDPMSLRETWSSFQLAYARAWRFKWDGITDALKLLTEKFSSMVCFCHHRDLLNKTEAFLIEKSISFIRIDGSVDPNNRETMLHSFAIGDARVALMGVTACGVGVSLATAQCALFCELPPDATWMAQAEDRLHRPGQRNKVNIFYVIGIHSLFDDRHFTRLQHAFQDWRQVVDGQFFDNRVVHHLTADSFEQPSHATPLPHATGKGTTWFTVSRNTGRIHICVTNSAMKSPSPSSPSWEHMSATLEEAQDYVRTRSLAFWRVLHQFLGFYCTLSPFQRRIFIHGRKTVEADGFRHTATWWTPQHRWTAPSPFSAVSRSFSRYGRRTSWSEQHGIGGWGCWYALWRPRSGSRTVYYYGYLWYDLFSYYPTCLSCQAELQYVGAEPEPLHSPFSMSPNYFPGAIVRVASDHFLFCSGRCREDYFVKRSSASLRYTVQRADGGVCCSCHVDCEGLRLELQATAAGDTQTRRDIIRRRHPLMFEFPFLVERVVEAPVGGNLWHADHIIPVAQGGGESGLGNIQTLCVACHQWKTQEDGKCLQFRRRKAAHFSVDADISLTEDLNLELLAVLNNEREFSTLQRAAWKLLKTVSSTAPLKTRRRKIN